MPIVRPAVGLPVANAEETVEGKEEEKTSRSEETIIDLPRRKVT